MTSLFEIHMLELALATRKAFGVSRAAFELPYPQRWINPLREEADGATMEHKATFDQWALVELMGHQRLAGRVTEAEIGGAKFVRVDVPAIGDLQPLTRFLGPSSIYGITPVTEETARALAQQIKAAPVSAWDARHLLKELPPPLDAQRSLPEPDFDRGYVDDKEESHDDEDINF